MRYDVTKLGADVISFRNRKARHSSFALRDCSKIGISKDILAYAKANLVKDRVRYAALLNPLENEKNYQYSDNCWQQVNF